MGKYHAFLLRCWCDEADTATPPNWRFVLVEIGSAPQSPRGFGQLEALVSFLTDQFAPAADTADPVPPAPRAESVKRVALDDSDVSGSTRPPDKGEH